MSDVSNNPSAPVTFRSSIGEKLFVTACAIFMGCIALFMLVAALGSFMVGPLLGFFILFIALILVALTWLVAKEMFSRWRLYAHLQDGVLTAQLPRRRGFIDQPRIRVAIPLADIERIETRHESFASIGVTTGQQAYAIVKRDGERLFLGADREWVPPFFGKLVDAILDRVEVPFIDLGMVDGDAGFLLVTRQRAPDWGTPSLPPKEIEKRNRRRARTGTIMMLVALLVVLAQFLNRG